MNVGKARPVGLGAVGMRTWAAFQAMDMIAAKDIVLVVVEGEIALRSARPCFFRQQVRSSHMATRDRRRGFQPARSNAKQSLSLLPAYEGVPKYARGTADALVAMRRTGDC